VYKLLACLLLVSTPIDFRVTNYIGPTNITASGHKVQKGFCAADWKHYPPGTIIKLNTGEYLIVADKGGAVKGSNHIDRWNPKPKKIFYPTRSKGIVVSRGGGNPYRAVIKAKQQMYELLRADKLGNHFPWVDAKDFNVGSKITECVDKRYSVRIGKQLGAPWIYNLDCVELFKVLASGFQDVSIVTMPRVCTHLLNAELMQSEYGNELHYSTYPTIMRKSLELGGKTVRGITANAIIDQYCDPSSADWLKELLILFPGAVIEFTVFDRDVGTIPHRNTIIWEVRNY